MCDFQDQSLSSKEGVPHAPTSQLLQKDVIGAQELILAGQESRKSEDWFTSTPWMNSAEYWKYCRKQELKSNLISWWDQWQPPPPWSK